jgi:hypothetical protein
MTHVSINPDTNERLTKTIARPIVSMDVSPGGEPAFVAVMVGSPRVVLCSFENQVFRE